MFSRIFGKEHPSREVISDRELGQSLVKFLEIAISSDLKDQKLRGYLQRGGTGFNFNNWQLALLAKMDLVKDGGFISIVSDYYNPTEPLIEPATVNFEGKVWHGIVFNRNNSYFSVNGISRQSNLAVEIAVETMFKIKNAQNAGQQVVPRKEANAFAMAFFARFQNI